MASKSARSRCSSGQRAVTLSDFVALARQAGGVAKVRARSRGWNQIDLYVAPEGDTCRPVPEDLKEGIYGDNLLSLLERHTPRLE